MIDAEAATKAINARHAKALAHLNKALLLERGLREVFTENEVNISYAADYSVVLVHFYRAQPRPNMAIAKGVVEKHMGKPVNNSKRWRREDGSLDGMVMRYPDDFVVVIEQPTGGER